METRRALRLCVTVAFILGMGALRSARSGEPSAVRTLPVTVHLLHFEGVPVLTTSITETEARRVVASANRIWSGTGISIVVDAVRKEEAIHDMAALGWLTTSHEDEGPDAVLANLAPIRPAVHHDKSRVHIYFIGTLPCNGITMVPDAVFVQDDPHLREVAGGGHDSRARVLAHELGHVFGLFHASEPDRLMSGGSTGVRVTESDIATVVRFVAGTAVHQ
jgi:hypothetical protein